MLLLGLAGAWLWSQRAPAAGLVELPEPALDALGEADRAQVETQRMRLRQMSASDPEALGEAYGQLGRLYLAYDMPQAAEAALANAEALQPDQGAWPYYRGVLAAEAGRSEAAIGHFARMRELEPDDLPNLLRLADAYSVAERYDEAAEVLDRALALAPDEARAHAQLGQLAIDRGDPAAAIAPLQRALELAPSADSLYYPLSQALRAQGDLAAAEAALARRGNGLALTRDDPRMRELFWLQQSAGSRMSQGSSLMDEGRFTEAASVFEAAVAAEPENAEARRNLGAALLSSGQIEPARAAVERALELDPGDAGVRFNLGLLALQTGDQVGAESQLRAAVAADPSLAPAQLALGRMLRRSARCEEALAPLSAYLELQRSDARSRMELVLCLARLGRWTEALERVESGHVAAPDDALIGEGLVRLLAAAPDDAVRDGARASELAAALVAGNRSVEALEASAMAEAETGQFEVAVRLQSEALEVVRLAGDRPEWQAFLEANLARYQQQRPAREPWPPYLLGD